MSTWIIWAIITLIALLVEVLTLGFAVICFAVGALIACVVAFAGGGVVMQLVAFSVVTIIALVAIRPFVIRYLLRSKTAVQTNTSALTGRLATVTQSFVGGVGRVSVDGDDWKAECEDEAVLLEVGERVVVVRVESVILIVKRR